jgi:glycosyltransferase involved in cell wall biosynthesis
VKLIIQIPCYNEEATLPETLADLPKAIDGIDIIETLVIDDGSSDQTASVARNLGVDHVVRFARNRGLALAFAGGLDVCLNAGADIIVNTDGDHQYQGACIPDLVGPIVRGEADMVVGDRQVDTIAHFSWLKKILQKLGTRVVRWTSATDVKDATSGFRALSRQAAAQLVVFSSYTYTLETIIQAGKRGLVVASIPVETNPKLRESRLISNIFSYVLRSSLTILRIFMMYEALRVFSLISLMPALAGVVLFVRYAYYFSIGQGSGHIQSVVVASVLLLLAFQILLLGLLADLIAKNRRLSEEIHYRMRSEKGFPPSRDSGDK